LKHRSGSEVKYLRREEEGESREPCLELSGLGRAEGTTISARAKDARGQPEVVSKKEARAKGKEKVPIRKKTQKPNRKPLKDRGRERLEYRVRELLEKSPMQI